jgi:citrate lyase subunit beta/citryl-CoA lyase
MTPGIGDARTFLFAPGNRPDRFAKAAAREHVRGWLGQHHPVVIRIHGADTPWYDDDIAMIISCPGAVAAVMVPKAEDPERLASLSVALPAGTGIIPLIETAAGVLRAASLCAQPGVIRPAFGSLDLAAQLGVDYREHGALSHARPALVLAAAAAGCAPPADGVTTDLTDESVLAADLKHAVTLGFTGKLCIHPRQVSTANRWLTPSGTETDWAREVIATAQNGAVGVHDSQMIDRPVVLRAEAILARAARTGQEG